MSNCILIEAGQCGNQLGLSILDHLNNHHNSQNIGKDGSTISDWDNNNFRINKNGCKYARAVCLDTEPKVIDECLRTKNEVKGRKDWSFDSKSIGK